MLTDPDYAELDEMIDGMLLDDRACEMCANSSLRKRDGLHLVCKLTGDVVDFERGMDCFEAKHG